MRPPIPAVLPPSTIEGTGRYRTPLDERYATAAMSWLWSDDRKFRLWRRLWLALAEEEADLGVEITEEQLIEVSEVGPKVAQSIRRSLMPRSKSDAGHRDFRDTNYCG